MLLKIDNRVINTDNITHAELLSGSPESPSTAVWLDFDMGGTGINRQTFEGEQAKALWAALTGLAEDATPSRRP